MKVVVQPPPTYKVYVIGVNTFRAVVTQLPATRIVVTQTILQGPKGDQGEPGTGVDFSNVTEDIVITDWTKGIILFTESGRSARLRLEEDGAELFLKLTEIT